MDAAMSKEKKLTNKQLRELLTTQSYNIEALEDEIEYLKGEHATNKARIWELIQQNDTLTMKYCPYRPPGDEDEDIDYYDLKDENAKLRAENLGLALKLYNVPRKAPEIPVKKKVKNDRWWNFSIELWPGAWGLNYYRYDWKKYSANTREGQMQIGPFGFSWNREPKR